MSARLGVLISGRGSNLVAIADAIGRGELEASIAIVISNRADAAGIERARERGIPHAVIPHRDYRTRDEHESEVASVLEASGVDFVVLAGYMRKLDRTLLEAFTNRIVNIHPSLLPSFPGTDAQRQAIEHGVRVSGCTVHIVDESLDGGPILMQRAVEVRDDDDVESLSARILVEEHRAYVDALRRLIAGVRIEGRRVVNAD